MRIHAISAAFALLAIGAGVGQALTADSVTLSFLERKNLPYPQDKPLPMPISSAAVMAHNKQVVLDFYKIISDKREWTDENRKKYFQDDFIQHDPAEPNTSDAFFNFFRTMMPPAGAADPAKPRMQMRMPGTSSVDSNGSPVNWMVAEGDIVVVARHRNWDWSGGPTPVYSGIFVDIWRLRDGKIAEQWCSATPADANVNLINSMLKQGKFPKGKDWD